MDIIATACISGSIGFFAAKQLNPPETVAVGDSVIQQFAEDNHLDYHSAHRIMWEQVAKNIEELRDCKKHDGAEADLGIQFNTRHMSYKIKCSNATTGDACYLEGSPRATTSQ